MYGRRKDVSGFPFLSTKLSSKKRPSCVQFDYTCITMKYGEMAFVLRYGIYGRRKDVSGFPLLSTKLSSKTRPS